MNAITISVQLFGAFREYGDEIAFSIGKGSPAREVKDAIAQALGRKADGLVHDSVLADEKTILPDNYIFDGDARLSILPPVCGG